MRSFVQHFSRTILKLVDITSILSQKFTRLTHCEIPNLLIVPGLYLNVSWNFTLSFQNVQNAQYLRHVHLETLFNMLKAFSRELSWIWINDVVSAILQSPWATYKAARSHTKEQVTMNCWEEKERLSLRVFKYVHTNHVWFVIKWNQRCIQFLIKGT